MEKSVDSSMKNSLQMCLNFNSRRLYSSSVFFLTVSCLCSLEHSLDWFKRLNLTSCQGRIGMPKIYNAIPCVSLVLPLLSFHFLFLSFSLEVFLLMSLPLAKRSHSQKEREFLFCWRSNNKFKCHPLDLCEMLRLPASFWAFIRNRKAKEKEWNAD